MLRIIDGRVFNYRQMPVTGIDNARIVAFPKSEQLAKRAPLPIPHGDSSGRPVAILTAEATDALTPTQALDRLADHLTEVN